MKTIKRYREARGIKQIELAARFGVAQPTIVKWESEEGYPPSRYSLSSWICPRAGVMCW